MHKFHHHTIDNAKARVSLKAYAACLTFIILFLMVHIWLKQPATVLQIHIPTRKLWNVKDVSWMQIVDLYEKCTLGIYNLCSKLTRSHTCYKCGLWCLTPLLTIMLYRLHLAWAGFDVITETSHNTQYSQKWIYLKYSQVCSCLVCPWNGNRFTNATCTFCYRRYYCRYICLIILESSWNTRRDCWYESTIYNNWELQTMIV
jgi:hypothetical protein